MTGWSDGSGVALADALLAAGLDVEHLDRLALCLVAADSGAM